MVSEPDPITTDEPPTGTVCEPITTLEDESMLKLDEPITIGAGAGTEVGLTDGVAGFAGCPLPVPVPAP